MRLNLLQVARNLVTAVEAAGIRRDVRADKKLGKSKKVGRGGSAHWRFGDSDMIEEFNESDKMALEEYGRKR
jgi:hypothetical protein